MTEFTESDVTNGELNVLAASVTGQEPRDGDHAIVILLQDAGDGMARPYVITNLPGMDLDVADFMVHYLDAAYPAWRCGSCRDRGSGGAGHAAG